MLAAFEMKGITKSFPGIIANDQIDFSVNKSEIRGLLGENGAGKSVLMKILYGLYRSDEGEIFVNGRLTEMDSPANAIKQGIGMVHQHFMLVPSLTVIENIILGKESTKRKIFLDENVMMKDVTNFCKLYNLDVKKIVEKLRHDDLPISAQYTKKKETRNKEKIQRNTTTVIG